MRKVIMWNMVTLDGFFEGPTSWDIDWHEYVWGEELEQLVIEQSKSVGTLLFGRVTYQGMAGYWSSATGEIADFMNNVPKVVFSRTLDRADWNNTRLVKGNAEEEVTKLRQQPGKDLFIFGSANLSSTFMRHGLIDECRLGLNPLVLGGGSPLFKTGPDRLKLRLLEARPLKSGVVLLRYQPAWIENATSHQSRPCCRKEAPRHDRLRRVRDSRHRNFGPTLVGMVRGLHDHH